MASGPHPRGAGDRRFSQRLTATENAVNQLCPGMRPRAKCPHLNPDDRADNDVCQERPMSTAGFGVQDAQFAAGIPDTSL